MAVYLSRTRVLGATTDSPFTRDFKHLLPIPRHWLIRRSWEMQKIKIVRPSDRIKYWNIVPGDRITDRRDPSRTVHEVLSINKLSNKVFLKGPINEDMAKEGKRRQAKSIHYSRCQLCIGEEKIKHRGLMVSRQVFAARLCVKNKRWDSFRKRYTWDRYASAVWPRVPRISETAQRVLNKQPITWPKLERRKPVPADIRMDTPESIVAKITYKPPPLPTSVSAPIPKPALESAYINSLFNPSPFPFDESQPVEVHVVKELSNPHSRAKKQARWQRYQGYKDDLRKEMISNELKNLNGRNTREATAEAMYKWRQAIEDEERAKQKARWLTKERVKKIERNRKSKEKKTRRQGERLRDLVLAEAPNQVLPKQVSERRRAA